ncbi:hypothetical protein FNV43_RR22375 [Rhamnella rubrinervis]|uniref:Uncharacterized protein n=1 Tax=Rhamnella rubrinervis TaxID=2594499 RepID=A0A8K0DW24_9ROSA|nr:hypothetical protein FNV43_RR22375 [Rhamnella rubrinervis]
MGCGISKLEHGAVRSACEANHQRGDHHHHNSQVHKNKILPMQETEMIKRRSNSEDDLKDRDHTWMEKKEVDHHKQGGHADDQVQEDRQKEDQENGPHLFYRENSLFFPGSPSFRDYCVNNIVVDDDCDSMDSFNFNKGNDVEGENKQKKSEMNNIVDGNEKKQNKSQMNNIDVDGDHQIKQNNILKSEMNNINIVDGEKKQNTSEIMESRPRDHTDKVQQPEGPQVHEKKVGRVRRFRNAMSRNRQARKSTLNVHNTNYSSSNNNNNPQKLVGKAA